MEDVKKLVRLQLLVIIIFIVMKYFRSDWVTDQSPAFWVVFLYSFPNFCEGLVGVLVLTGIAVYLKPTLFVKLKYPVLYYSVAMLALVYTVTQEIKLHNLGGENIYDPYDVLFSVVGVGAGLLVVLYIQPAVKSTT